MKKLTVGDNSGTQRFGQCCTVVRTSLAEIEVGEKVLIRFKDEFEVTKYRCYKLASKKFKDEYDKSRGRYTGKFVRAEEGEANDE